MNLECAEQLLITLLQAKNIDVNLKTCKNLAFEPDKKAIDYCKENTSTLKVLLQNGQLSAENANDHVTRNLDRGGNLQKENDLNGALTNYKVANLLLKEFSATTDEKLRLRCFKCFEQVY